MVECSFCDEEFEDDIDLHVHWGEEHEDELNSHQKDKVKKARRKQEELKQEKNAKRKKMAGMGLAGLGALVVIALLGSQVIGNGSPGTGNSAEISIEGEPMVGNPDANITIVEFSDFQCPYCAQFSQQTYPQIVDNYIESGQVKMVSKDYPLTEIGHDWARPAAMTAECVYREGGDEAFWNVKEKIYNNQNSISGGNVESQIIGYAQEENVSADAINACLNNGNPGQEVDQDKREGRNSGVTGTPTVFVNGEEINSEYSSIRAAIEQQLR